MRAFVASLVLVAACADPPATMENPIGELSLAITSPTPGQELTGTEPTITVTGTVATTSFSDVLVVWINGVEADVSGEAFTLDLPVEPGINHIAVEASDGYLVKSQALDVLYAAEYIAPTAGTANFEVADAIELRLGQRFFDIRRFGTELDVATDPVVASDLAAALELVLHHVQLDALLPDRIQFGSGDAVLDIAIGSVQPQRIVVDARIVNTPAPALELHIALLGVNLPMDGQFRFDTRTMIIDGGISADMHATATLTLAVTGGAIDVGATSVIARVGPLVPAFVGPDGDELNALVTLAESDFRTVIEGLITQELIPTFTDRVPPLLETLLGSIGELLSDTMFTLDTGLGGEPVTLTLDSNIGGLDVVPGAGISTTPGHVTVRQNVSIGAAGTPIHATTLGAPRIVTPERPVDAEHGVGLSLRLDMLNALLHTLWNRGLLEGGAMTGGFNAVVSAKLPPVVTATKPSSSCRIDGEACDVTLQLGQLEIGLADFGQTFGINATAGARIVVEGDKVSLKIQEVPSLTVWEISNNGDGRLTPEAVSDLIKNVVWPELFGAIGANLSITLPPLPDLSTLGLDTIAPTLANAELELAIDPRPDVKTGFLSLGADVKLSTPTPP